METDFIWNRMCRNSRVMELQKSVDIWVVNHQDEASRSVTMINKVRLPGLPEKTRKRDRLEKPFLGANKLQSPSSKVTPAEKEKISIGLWMNFRKGNGNPLQ